MKNLEEKKKRMKNKIEKLERDKFTYNVAQFSDYEAFALLDES